MTDQQNQPQQILHTYDGTTYAVVNDPYVQAQYALADQQDNQIPVHLQHGHVATGQQLPEIEPSRPEGQEKWQRFWAEVNQEIDQLDGRAFKDPPVPLARIKKIMKIDEDVRMISAEAPVLFAKACEIFIRELSLRAWLATEEGKRRTMQRNDITMAASRCDMFDFLIDILPREDIKPARRTDPPPSSQSVITGVETSQAQQQYYIQVPQTSDQQQKTPTQIPVPLDSSHLQGQQILQLPQQGDTSQHITAEMLQSPQVMQVLSSQLNLQDGQPQLATINGQTVLIVHQQN